MDNSTTKRSQIATASPTDSISASRHVVEGVAFAAMKPQITTAGIRPSQSMVRLKAMKAAEMYSSGRSAGMRGTSPCRTSPMVISAVPSSVPITPRTNGTLLGTALITMVISAVPSSVPFVLGVIGTLLGTALITMGLVRQGEVPRMPALRPLLYISAAFIAFSLTIDWLGLIPAVVICGFIAAKATPSTTWREALMLSVGLAVAIWLLFVVLLSMPIRVWAGF